jgi:tRNA-2-methylthio-N6-dimethylallyladenosine synthase
VLHQEKAEQKFYSLMGRLQHLRRKKGTILGVTGCIAQQEKENVFERLPFIDFSLGPSSIHLIAEAVKNAADRIARPRSASTGARRPFLSGPITPARGSRAT